MITVHHLDNSRSQRILWLLEELELPYEIKHYKRGSDMLAPAELRRIHPLGKSPVLTDGDVVVAESGNIIEYILDKYGNGRLRPPEGSPERLKYRFWTYYSDGQVMAPLIVSLIFKSIVDAKKPFFVQPIAKAIATQVHKTYVDPNMKSHLDYMESELTRNTWFAGAQFSAADIIMSFPLEASRSRADLDESRPHLIKYLETIHARPAYKRALERGGPYAYA